MFLALMAAGLLAGLPDLRARIAAEQAARTVDLVADQASFAALATAYGVSPAAFLRRLQGAGVRALGVAEDSLASLEAAGRLTALSGADWLVARRAAGLPPPPGTVDPAATYVLTRDRALAAWLLPALRRALGAGPGAVQLLARSGLPVLVVRRAPALTVGLPLGFAPGAFRLARRLGLHLVPRPEDSPAGLDAAGVASLVSRIASARLPVDAVLFAGPSSLPLPGYPRAFGVLVAGMRRHRWLLAALETPEQLGNVRQPGTEALDRALGERTVRAYSVPPWLLAQDSPAAAVLSIADSVRERNLRLVYLHPVVTGADPVGATVALVGALARDLTSHGFRLGAPQPFPAVAVPRALRQVQALAVTAAGLWLLELLFPGLGRYGYAPLAVAGGAAVALAAASARLGAEAVAMAAALAFGGLALVYATDLWVRVRPQARPSWPRLWRQGLVACAATSGITFAGALIVATVLGDTPHFLEWQYFHGVKVTYLALPAIAGLAFLARVGSGLLPAAGRGRAGALGAELRRLGAEPLRLRTLAWFLLVAAAAAIYLLRSGNVASSFVPGIEQRMRQDLALWLGHRPREKEYLVGYPSLFLAVASAARRRRWPFLLFLLGVAAGQVSVVDTFEHIRTPFVFSLVRETFGLLGGAVTGSGALAAAAGVARLHDRLRRGGPAGDGAPRPRAATPAPVPGDGLGTPPGDGRPAGATRPARAGRLASASPRTDQAGAGSA